MVIWNCPEPTLTAALGFEHLPAPAVVCAIGSGGKTTTLNTLAAEAVATGRRTLLTTTTHMRRTADCDCSGNPEQIRERLTQNGFCFAGIPAKCDKIASFPLEVLHQLVNYCDLALIEADGSKGLPLKLHRCGEPVLPPETQIALRLVGLSALGGRVEDVCHRWTLSGVSGRTLVDYTVFAEILQKDALILPENVRLVTLFHQADTPELAELGEKIANLLCLGDYLILSHHFIRN